MNKKKDLENEFDWWITSIPDKIELLGSFVPKQVLSQLDFSLNSLIILGDYILENWDVKLLKAELLKWDALAAYIGKTYRKNVPTAEWFIELDNINEIYYNTPYIITQTKTRFIPHFEITTMINRKNNNFIYALTKRHIEIQN